MGGRRRVGELGGMFASPPGYLLNPPFKEYKYGSCPCRALMELSH
jgi:hypothetical protein